MHFKADRVDRDKLDPAARRVDDLMNMYASDMHDSARGAEWLAEIQGGVEQVMNPRVAEALGNARVDIRALNDVMGLPGKPAAAAMSKRPAA
jgi:hypothetical protein